ncbi:hypothetical protein BS47DRAFT_1297726 [Hydnum rufescens UP504]|uniref:Secretion-regulating guanine nucleotide exchange factor n=1 Tax=Hydnum rufescens UP504 TaxID=1448309 RepID=A0A9P6DW48_9AGAM|nr:hypothetical protein BS47DRAFT_1297726 [Hydnum rufescens UP504]
MALFSSGSNAKGQLGSGDTSDKHQFSRCSFSSGCSDVGDLPSDIASVIQIASGSNHTLLLAESADGPPGRTRSRSVWVTGDGSRGQLGPHNHRGCQTFSRLDDVTLGNSSALRGYTPVAVAALWETSFLVLRPPEWKHGASDAVIAMGANDFGDLGQQRGQTQEQHRGRGRGRGRQRPTHNDSPSEEEYFFRVRRLEPGLHHVVAVLDVGSGSSSGVRQCLVGWGASRHGQLQFRPVLEIGASASASVTNSTGVFPEERSITSLALGQHHSVILSGEALFTAGSNKKGQLALDAAVVRGASSVHCTWNGTYVLCRPSDPDWQILATGSGDRGQLGVGVVSAQDGLRAVSFPFATRSKRVQSIACGSEHVLAVLVSLEGEGTEVWGWGWNEHGNLGLGHTHDVNVPVKIWPGSETAPPLGSVVSVWAGCGTSWVFVKGRSEG